MEYGSREWAKSKIMMAVQSGCKATELPSGLPVDFWSHEHTDVVTLLNELIASGDVLEVEYILPDSSYRVKSFLLPKYTTILPITKGGTRETLF